MMSLLSVILAPLVASLFVTALHRRAPKASAGLAMAALAVSAAAVFSLFSSALDSPRTLLISWAAPLGPDIALRADAFGLVLAAMVSLVGVAVVLYASGYLHGDPDLGRLYATLLVFAGGMQIVTLADDIWLVFVGWEVTSACSYLLVLHTRTPEARKAATTALLVTGGGGFALLAGLLLLQNATGVSLLSELGAAREALLASPLFLPALVCLVAGCATKSALFPFHFWLPGAMAAPSPVSAYLHAATMVKAGIFLLARLHPALGGTTAWEILLGAMGGLTVVAAALRLPSADDLKQMLAWSTVLALGTMGLLLSLDSPEAAVALVVFLIAHAAYKGTMFLVVGSIDHGTGTRSLDRLGGLCREMPWTAAAALLGAASMIGLPPFAGYVAKEQIKLAGASAQWLPTALLMFSAVALVVVAAWTGLQPFWRRRRAPELHPHESGVRMTAPILGLALAGLVIGLGSAAWLSPVLERAASDVAGRAVTAGFKPAPTTLVKALVAGVVVAAGLLLARLRPALARGAARVPSDLCARAWERFVKGCVEAGRLCLRSTQHGDVRYYIGVLLAGAGLLIAPAFPGMTWTLKSGLPMEKWMAVPAIILTTGALLASRSPRRIVVVASLGAVGYGMALLYIGLGAPDVALTQVLVDTITVVLLVLAFRQLPPVPHRSWRSRGYVVQVVALIAGLAAALLVMAANQAGNVSGLGEKLIRAAWDRGRGANAVNVILVDIRALDTLGEITVLLIASIGVLSLIATVPRTHSLISRSPILTEASRHVFTLAMLLAAFLLWRGHHAPGGGFAAGLCFSASVLLIAATRGAAAARRTVRLPPLVWAGGGLILALASGLIGVAAGRGFMHPVWYGPVGTPLLFDLGVFAVVVGSVVMAAEQLLEAEEANR